jgi:molybdopterin converting factor subunit 1
MTVHVFARLRELLGTGSVEIALPDGTTAAALRTYMAARWPEAAAVLAKSLVAVDNEYVADDYNLPPDATVALIPPVSGG